MRGWHIGVIALVLLAIGAFFLLRKQPMMGGIPANAAAQANAAAAAQAAAAKAKADAEIARINAIAGAVDTAIKVGGSVFNKLSENWDTELAPVFMEGDDTE